MMTLAERLREARNFLKISQPEMAKRLGISKPAWQGYELGKNEPGSSVIWGMIRLGFDANWLLTGEGSMTGDEVKYDEDLLQAVIEISESYWAKEEKKVSPSEKASIITNVYDIAIGMNLEKSKIEELLEGYGKFDAVMCTAVERMSDLVSGEIYRKAFERQLKRIFKGAYSSKEDLEFFIDGLIGSYAIRKHMRDGTLKFPVKGEDGTIRLVDFKDREAEKKPKNQKPQ
ncbi:MAG: helix-turn-helix transcriptional regulator [Candidatus Omnitrophota bacterium]